jgi:hypothetical protein
MKPFAILFAILFALIVGGCADPLEQRSSEELKSQFQRGITGQGRAPENESTNNPTGVPAKEAERSDYPPQ